MANYPPFFEEVEKNDPELNAILRKQYDFIMKPGAIDIKTKLLINLAVDAITGSSGVNGISKLARKLGASEEEIKETLRIAFQVAGFKVINTNLSAFE